MKNDEIKSKLDSLFEDVKAYRNSQYFKELLEFCAKFKTLAPYNAMLVRLQMREARFVLTASEWWRRYGRAIQPNARPLVVLFPFGPVDFVFEIQDTFTPENAKQRFSDQQILEEMENPYKTHGKLEANVLKRLIAYMQYHGIVYNPNLVAGVGFGAELRLLIETNKQVHVRINKNVDIIWKANYLLSTNSQADDAQKFASIIHELGHFFCHHLPAPIGWGVAWDVRNLSHEAEEFEAEATARIICDRLNIKNQSERYLSSYLDEHEELPEGVSVENICYAANKILVMCSGAKFTYRDGLLFKHNKEFQNIVKNISKKDSKL